jgi:hypothetical protein
MLEVHIAQQPGESMGDLRRRVRSFCEGNRVPFEQAGQIPQALAIFVADEATREVVQQGLSGLATPVASSPVAAEAPPAVPASEQTSNEAAAGAPLRREKLRPSKS